MRTSSAKAKGRRPMLWLRERLLAAFPQLQADDVRVTPSGTPGPDLQLSPAAQTLFPFAVESKNHEALNIWAALQQAEAHADGYVAASRLDPVVVFTRNRHKIYVALEAETFIELLKKP